MKTKFKPGWKPQGNRILVWPIATEEVTAGGIVIAGDVTKREDMKQIEAIVIAIGKGSWADKTIVERGKRVPSGAWCKEGDIIQMAAYAGLYYKGADGKSYRTISDLDVVSTEDNTEYEFDVNRQGVLK